MDADPQPSPARIDWVQVFFSSTGRMGRGLFVVTGVVLLAILYGYDAIAGGVLRLLTGWAVFFLIFFSSACILSKRLHDRGRSGWWAALVLWAFIVVWPEPDGLIDFLFVLILAAAAIELCLRPGEPTANRFGPPG
jgi:uncharacterized membrane protein YhaH (DUF805 family)